MCLDSATRFSYPIRMKKLKRPIVGTLIGIALSFSAQAEQLINPVAHCADCVMMKHRGTYYMTGTGAHGKMLTSTNLTDWSQPAPFFQTQLKWTDEEHTLDMHAPGFKYYNDQFYFYWNGIACATADEVLGPYRDLNINDRFDGEIDPFLFIDEDGRFYFYTVKFDHSNIIYGQEMASPLELKGQAVRLLEPRANSWETRCKKILEGPEVIRYRNTYYMLYAANHTSVKYGHYLMGCATSDSPLGFNEDSKYPLPVMQQSDERIDASVQTLVEWKSAWSYTHSRPSTNWKKPDFEEAGIWTIGTGGFGWPIIEQSRIHDVQTLWESDEIWMRKTFTLSDQPSKNLQLKIKHQGSTEVFLNGKSIYSKDQWGGPQLVALSQKSMDALQIGQNVIAVHCSGAKKKRYIDVGMIDPGKQLEDDLIWNTGQPNLVRGLNGFEWFVSYFALWNSGPHMQGINRVFFFDRKLHIDGPTGARPPQYQPRPYPATFADNMETPGNLSPETWECIGGSWRVIDGQAEVTGVKTALALIRTNPAINYLFQTWIEPQDQGSCGIVAWYIDGKNNLILHLDQRTQTLICTQYLKGKKTLQSYPLHDGFDFSAYHKIRVEKNADLAEIWIDEIRLTRAAPLKVPTMPGRPGLFSRNTRTAFDAVLYTVGWDEFDERIRGWKPNKKGLPPTKGDWMEHYEFSAQVIFKSRKKAGVYPVFINTQNYLLVEYNPVTHRLRAYGKRNGQKFQTLEAEGPASDSINLRTVKLADRVLIMLNGKQVFEIPGAWPASQVGLSNRDGTAIFNGISCFQIP